jgi:hypothetical protein
MFTLNTKNLFKRIFSIKPIETRNFTFSTSGRNQDNTQYQDLTSNKQYPGTSRWKGSAYGKAAKGSKKLKNEPGSVQYEAGSTQYVSHFLKELSWLKSPNSQPESSTQRQSR